jgi:peptidoglycan/xylan/chitin deacetylase (PgdA/CDA1 family)
MNRSQPITTPITRLAHLPGAPGRVVLTFDDGPEPPWTTRILDLLEQTGTPATFFVLGSRIAGREQVLRRMVGSGCAVEVHAWEHLRLTDQRPHQRMDDLRRTADLIRDVTGHDPTCARPPEGRVSVEVLDDIHAAGLTPVFWSLHGGDWTNPGAAAIEHAIVDGLADGAVILLHDGGGDRSQTVTALPGIIAAIHDQGLRPVTISPPLLAPVTHG